MATEEKMDIDERFKYLRMQQKRYRELERKKEKSRLLDEMQAMTGLNRRYLTGWMGNKTPYRKHRSRERGRTYGPEVQEAVVFIADTLDWICAERLKPALPKMARHLAKFGEMETTPKLLEQLTRISISTVRRILKRVGRPPDQLPRARRGRRADSVAQAMVPVAVIPWKQPEPGHFEVDLVHHSRYGIPGPFVCTFQCIDVLTGWSERIAILGHEFPTMWEACQQFDQQCPIPVREIHTDNGGEFINVPLVSKYGSQMLHTRMTRGVPGHKNDNRFVEQKNGSLVRAYLEDLYLYRPEHVLMLNALYADMWLYYNFFQPVLRQTARSAVLYANGVCRIIRKQDEAKTPLERLLQARPPISRNTAAELLDLYEETNPRVLNRRIHERLAQLKKASEADERRLALYA